MISRAARAASGEESRRQSRSLSALKNTMWLTAGKLSRTEESRFLSHSALDPPDTRVPERPGLVGSADPTSQIHTGLPPAT